MKDIQRPEPWGRPFGNWHDNNLSFRALDDQDATRENEALAEADLDIRSERAYAEAKANDTIPYVDPIEELPALAEDLLTDEEVGETIDSLYTDEDKASDDAKAFYYREKYGDL